MAAAPPSGRRCPCTACSSRESPRGAPRQEQQAANGYSIGQILPRSQRRAGKDSGSYAQCRRPSQRPRRGYPFRIPTAPPLALAAPAPHPRTTAAAAAGRAFPLGRLLRPGHRAGRARTRSAAQPLPSLHDPRHRSCTGSRLLAALPSHAALRQRSGSAAAAEAAKEYGTKPEAAQCPALILRITWLRLFAIAKAIDVQRLLHSHNPRYTHNRAGQISGSRRARATSGSGKAAASALSGAARSCCTLRSSPGRASGRGRRHSGPQLLHVAAAARAGQSRAAPLAGPRPRPSHPAQAAAKPGLSACLCLLL